MMSGRVELPAEEVDADICDHEGNGVWVVLRRVVFVVGRPRDVVVRRLRAADVLEVRQSSSA
ncbi:MAG: hypothetical protein JWM64_2080 [Frankiales bacterium]|nr:hypothetical protein [Frankiales bacterium]